MSWQQLNCDLEHSRAIKEARNKALDDAVASCGKIFGPDLRTLEKVKAAILALKESTP